MSCKEYSLPELTCGSLYMLTMFMFGKFYEETKKSAYIKCSKQAYH